MGAATQREHYRFLDGLRGLAILGVMLVHVSQSVPGLSTIGQMLCTYGGRGVELFFVVSGFTLTLTYMGRDFDSGQFFVRRLFRIAPMFYFAALAYILLGLVATVRFATVSPTIFETLSTLTFLHGWTPDTINRIVPGGWSIADEAMFYAVFPLLLALTRRPKLLLALALLSYPVGMAIQLGIPRVVPGDPVLVSKFAVFFWLSQLPAFVTGCALALIRPHLQPYRQFAPATFYAVAVAIPISAAFKATQNPFVADMLFGALALSASLAAPAILENRAMTRLGALSFSIYLTHFLFVGIFDLYSWSLPERIGTGATLALGFAGVFVGACATSTLTYRWIELPMIETGRRLSRNMARRTAEKPAPMVEEASALRS